MALPWKVRTDVPYGNACDVTIEEDEKNAIIQFAADPHGGPESLWFFLRLEGEESSSDKLKLVLKYPENLLGGGNPESMYPVVRFKGHGWRRLHSGIPEERDDGRVNAVWFLDVESRTLDFAFCYPYGEPDLRKLVSDTGDSFRLDKIGVSQNGRPLTRLSNYHRVNLERPGLFLMCRQHSGETPGSWVLDGFLRKLSNLGDETPFIWAIPLAHIDGVKGGHYGKDGYPYDLNRAWGHPPMRHETLVYKRDMGRWLDRCQSAIGIDFHAPGCCETGGIYCFLPNPDTYSDAHRMAKRAADRISAKLGRYADENFPRVAQYSSRWETPSFTAHCCSQKIYGLTIETPYGSSKGLILTRRDYREAGALIAEAIASLIRKVA